MLCQFKTFNNNTFIQSGVLSRYLNNIESTKKKIKIELRNDSMYIYLFKRNSPDSRN